MTDELKEMDIRHTIEQLRPVIEKAYSHVWDSISPLLLMRVGKDKYRKFENKQEYLEHQFKIWKMVVVKEWRNGKIVGIDHRIVLAEEKE